MGDSIFDLVDSVGDLEDEEADVASGPSREESNVSENPAVASNTTPIEAVPARTDDTLSTDIKPAKKQKQRARSNAQAPFLHSGRTLSKAKVQATARYDIKLYAEYQMWEERQRERGESTPSFTEVQNQALDLWLKKNVR